MTAKNPKTHRLPHWYASSDRWRMSIGFRHGSDGTRRPRPFYRRAEFNGGTPPPSIIALAVAKQDEWRTIKADWREISRDLRVVFPSHDWSLPVWADEERAKMKGGACRIEQSMSASFAEEDTRDERDAQHAAQWFARNGIAAMIDVLRSAFTPPEIHQSVPTATRSRIVERMDAERATALAELKPVEVRVMVKRVTVREAIDCYLANYAKGVSRQTSQAIEQTTSDTLAECLRCAFGQPSNPVHPPMRKTPINFDGPLSAVDQTQIEAFAEYWHGKPVGVTWYAKRGGSLLSKPTTIRSDRRVRNVLQAARQFFAWCAECPTYAWSFPASCRRKLTASDVKREALPFDPVAIAKIIAAGGPAGADVRAVRPVRRLLRI